MRQRELACVRWLCMSVQNELTKTHSVKRLGKRVFKATNICGCMEALAIHVVHEAVADLRALEVDDDEGVGGDDAAAPSDGQTLGNSDL